MDLIRKVEILGEGSDAKTARVPDGEIVTIRTIASHPSDTKPSDGANDSTASMLKRLTAKYGDDEIFRADFHAGMSAYPYVTFTLRPPKSGKLSVTWTDHSGNSWSDERDITVA